MPTSIGSSRKQERSRNIYFCFIDYAKTFDCVDPNKLWNILKEREYQAPDLSPEKSICRSRRNSENWTWNNILIPNRERNMSRLFIVTLLI